jgi:hypothetical protein
VGGRPARTLSARLERAAKLGVLAASLPDLTGSRDADTIRYTRHV